MSQLIKRIINYLERIRFTLMINTSMYMWEPWEIRIFSMFILIKLIAFFQFQFIYMDFQCLYDIIIYSTHIIAVFYFLIF